jgi:hypothetical protein
MIETAALLVPVAQVKATSELEKRRQHILGHRSSVGQTAGGGHHNIGVPKIGVEKIAGSCGQFMDPSQARRAHSQVLERWPTREHDLGRGEDVLTLREGRHQVFIDNKIPVNGPLRPRGAKLHVKPTPGVDYLESAVDLLDPV